VHVVQFVTTGSRCHIISILNSTACKVGTLCPEYSLSVGLCVGTTNKKCIVRFEVFTAVTMKNGVFWDVTPCGSCKNRRFGGT
jgi:hypothetical protein